MLGEEEFNYFIHFVQEKCFLIRVFEITSNVATTQKEFPTTYIQDGGMLNSEV